MDTSRGRVTDMPILLTRFSPCLLGRAPYHKNDLIPWARDALLDDPLVATGQLSDEAKLRCVMDLADIQNKNFAVSSSGE